MVDRKKEKAKKGKRGKLDFDRDELYFNEDDRLMLNNKPELERESILDERYQSKLKEEERKQLLKEKSEKENKTEQDKKRDAIEDIKKRRQNNRKDSDSSESESGEISEDDEDSDSELSDEFSLSISNDERKGKSKKESKSLPSFKLSLQELEKIRVSRMMIEKWWENNFFESTVKGCFIKINVCRDKEKNNFELIVAQIKDIIDKPEKPYNFMGKVCTKYINALWAKYEKSFNFAIISNSPFGEKEYNVWLDKMNQLLIPLPSEEFIKKKTDELKNAENYKYSSQEIKEIITKKKEQKLKNFEKNINITYELSILTEEYNAALMKMKENENNKEKEQFFKKKVDDLKEKLEILRKMTKERELNDSEFAELDIVSQINRKNLEKQKKNDLKLSMINKKKQREDDGGSNFYRRRECKPTNLWNSGYSEAETKDSLFANIPTPNPKIVESNMILIDTNQQALKTNNSVDHKILIEKIKGLTDSFDKILDERPLIINKTEGCLYPTILTNISSYEILKLLTSSIRPEGAKFVTLDELKYES